MDWGVSTSSQIVDPRNDCATRLRYPEGFCEFLLCKLDPGFFLLKLLHLVTHLSQLLGSLYQRFLLRWASAYRLSSSQIEFVCNMINEHIQTSRGPRVHRRPCSRKVCASLICEWWWTKKGSCARRCVCSGAWWRIEARAAKNSVRDLRVGLLWQTAMHGQELQLVAEHDRSLGGV